MAEGLGATGGLNSGTPAIPPSLAIASPVANGNNAMDEDTARTWPTETDEAAYRAEAAAPEADPLLASKAPRPAADSAAQEETADELPALDERVRRIPAGVRETLDELFRARFTRIVRIKKPAPAGPA